MFQSSYLLFLRAKDYLLLSFLNEVIPNVEQGSCRTDAADSIRLIYQLI